MKHERGQHAIESPVWIVEGIRETAMKLDDRACAFGLSRRSRERSLVRIHTDDVDVRVQRVRKNDQASGSAADVEYAMTWAEFRLAQKLLSCTIESEQRRDRVVEGQEPIEAHSR
jgi:hypothetical protein